MTSTTFFIIFIPILAILLLAINLILAPHNPYQEKDSVFECGFHSFLGQNRTQFSVSFFIFALLFLLFDLEILLVYPYSVSTYTNDIYGLAVMMAFFVLLTLGFIFELGKNALTIDSRQTSNYGKVHSSETHAFLTGINTLNPFSPSTLHSAVFTISRKMIIGFVSSIIVAGFAYAIRLTLLKCWSYDVFTNLENWSISLTYFCSLAGVRYLISEWLTHKLAMFYLDGPTGDINSISGNDSLRNNRISSLMRAPDNNSGSNSPGDSYDNAARPQRGGDYSRSPSPDGTGADWTQWALHGDRPDSSLGMNEPTTPYAAANDQALGQLESLAGAVEASGKWSRSKHKEMVYSWDVDEDTQKVQKLESEKQEYIAQGKEEMWNKQHSEALAALKESEDKLAMQKEETKELKREADLAEQNYDAGYPFTPNNPISENR